MAEWLRKHGVVPRSTISSNSLVALVGITASGLGVAYLPRVAVLNLLESGQLQELNATPKLPKIRYVTMIRSDASTPFLRRMVELAQRTCDFERPYQAPGTGTDASHSITGS